jgi:hypothetical protein
MADRRRDTRYLIVRHNEDFVTFLDWDGTFVPQRNRARSFEGRPIAAYAAKTFGGEVALVKDYPAW